MHEPVIQFTPRPGLLDLGWGHPRPGLLPVRAWAAAQAATGWEALTYGHATGPGPLLEWLSDRLGDVSPAETFVTGGVSHALALISQVLAQPRDVVLVDAPTYHLAFRIFADHGLEVVPVPSGDDGLDPAAVRERLRDLRRAGRRVPLLYLVPTFGNPTGRSLPDDRRRALVDLAAAEGCTVVEDDTYRELVYEGAAPESLWRISGGTAVVRLGSFAKTVAPGLRLGWINAGPGVVARLAGLGYVVSGGGVNHAAAMAMASFGAGGGYDDHVRWVRSHYRTQRDALAETLRDRLPSLVVPPGGWFLWFRLPDGLTADALLPRAEALGTSFVPGPLFHPDGRGSANRIRLSFSHLGPDDLRRAAHRLADAIILPSRDRRRLFTPDGPR